VQHSHLELTVEVHVVVVKMVATFVDRPLVDSKPIPLLSPELPELANNSVRFEQKRCTWGGTSVLIKGSKRLGEDITGENCVNMTSADKNSS
jgi:hypothetical protein